MNYLHNLPPEKTWLKFLNNLKIKSSKEYNTLKKINSNKEKDKNVLR